MQNSIETVKIDFFCSKCEYRQLPPGLGPLMPPIFHPNNSFHRPYRIVNFHLIIDIKRVQYILKYEQKNSMKIK